MTVETLQTPIVRRYVVGSLLGLLLAAVVGTTLALGWILVSERDWRSAHVFLPVALTLALVLVAFAIPWYVSALRAWSRRGLTPTDVLLGTWAAGLASFNGWWLLLAGVEPDRQARVFATALAASLGITICARWILVWWRRWSAPPQSLATNPLLAQVLAASTLAPLSGAGDDDLLERGPIVELLEWAIRSDSKASMTLALNGPMGSGKTTILNAIEARLSESGCIVVRFNAWNFREPERLITNYLDELGRALRKAGFAHGLRSQLRGLGKGVASLGGSRIRDAVEAIASGDFGATTDELRDEIRFALSRTASSLVVLVDDLDRLDRSELEAAFRSVRLFSELPGLTHVLAYDREQVVSALFPGVESVSRARDYLAKIVTLEVPLAALTSAMSMRLLNAALAPLFVYVSEADATEFGERLNSFPRQFLTFALSTPREVRRVAAMTAWVWHSLASNLNLFDLFILQVIHLRYPDLFGTIHAHPEWFTEWGEDPWRISEDKRWDAERSAYLTDYAGQSAEAWGAIQLLSQVFPKLTSPRRTPLTERHARSSRRACHAVVFPRYFQFGVAGDRIAETTMEDLARSLVAAAPGARAGLIDSAIRSAINEGKEADFFGQWDMFVAELRRGSRAGDPDLLREVCHGIATIATSLSGDWDNPLAPRRAAAWSILELVGLISSPPAASRILSEVITTSRSLDLAGHLVFYTCLAEESRRYPMGVTFDASMIRGSFDALVREETRNYPSEVFDLPKEDLGSILFRTQDAALVRAVFLDGLANSPASLPTLLRLSVKLLADGPVGASPTIVYDGLEDLDDRVGISKIDALTGHLPIDQWDDPIDRATVEFFRRRAHSGVSVDTDGPLTGELGAAG